MPGRRHGERHEQDQTLQVAKPMPNAHRVRRHLTFDRSTVCCSVAAADKAAATAGMGFSDHPARHNRDRGPERHAQARATTGHAPVHGCAAPDRPISGNIPMK
jgi:hypothetical protein